MSRIGYKIIKIPVGCHVQVARANTIVVAGPGGKLTHQVPRAVQVTVVNREITVTRANDSKRNKQVHGTTNALIRNMLVGVSTGWVKELEIHGIGYRAQVNGRHLVMQLGYSHVIDFPIPVGIDVTVTRNTQLKVTGIDKQQVGQVAAKIKLYRPVEPYKGKGIRYKNEIIRRKEVKSATKTT